jgi:flagellar motor switch protein FliM
MKDILSQDEVDALLRGVQSGDIGTGAAKDQPLSSIRPYDLTSQECIVRGRMPGLEIANERFSRFFRSSISALIMRFIDIAIQNVEIIKFSEFMKVIPYPSSIHIIKMDPLKGYALFIMDAPLVLAFVEFFFGGSSAKHVESEGRSFTPIEQRIIKKIAMLALKDLSAAWEGIVPICPEHIGFEMNPQFVTIVMPSEIVIKIEVVIEIEGFIGKVFFCIPYAMIEPVKEKLSSTIQTDTFEQDKRWIPMLREMLLSSDVEMVAEVGKAKLTFKELMDLKAGNVIILGKAASDDLSVKIEGVPKFTGVPGYRKGNQAIRITGLL